MISPFVHIRTPPLVQQSLLIIFCPTQNPTNANLYATLFPLDPPLY